MRIDITEALWLDDHHQYSLRELVELSGLSTTELQHLIDCEALLPLAAAGASAARFSSHCLALACSAARLRRDFDLDENGLALAWRLLERIRELEAELNDLRAQVPHSPR